MMISSTIGSAIGIISSILLLFLYFTGCLKQFAKPKNRSKWIMFVKVLLVIFIVILIGTVLFINIFGKSDDTTKQTNPMEAVEKALDESENQLKKIPYSNLDAAKTEIIANFLDLHDEFSNVIHFSNLSDFVSNYEKDLSNVITANDKFQEWIVRGKSDETRDCSIEQRISKNSFQEMDTATKVIKAMRNTFKNIKNNLIFEIISLKNMKLDTDVYSNTMLNIVSHLRTDFQKINSVKQDRLSRNAPTLSRQTILKVILNFSYGLLLLISSILLLGCFCSFKRCCCCKWPTWMLLLAQFSSIIICISIGTFSLDLIGEQECTLNRDNFGILEISTPFEFKDVAGSESREIIICQKTEASIFTTLDSQHFLNFDTVSNLFKIQDLKTSAINAITDTKLEPIKLEKFTKSLESVYTSLGELTQKIAKLSDQKCFTNEENAIISDYIEEMKTIIEHSRLYESLVLEYNSKIRDSTNLAELTMNKWMHSSKSSISNAVDSINKYIQSADMKCDSLHNDFTIYVDDICTEQNASEEGNLVFMVVVGIYCFILNFISAVLYCLAKIEYVALPKQPKISIQKENAPKNRTIKSPAIQNVIAPSPPKEHLAETGKSPSPAPLTVTTPNTQAEPSLEFPEPTPDNINNPENIRKRLRLLKEAKDKEDEQNKSDIRSAKFAQRGPLGLPNKNLKLEYGPENEEKEVILDKVYLDPTGNEMFLIGSEFDFLPKDDLDHTQASNSDTEQ